MAFFKSYGLKTLNANLSIFIKLGLIVIVYKDDFQIRGSFPTEIYKIKLVLSEKFHILNFGS